MTGADAGGEGTTAGARRWDAARGAWAGFLDLVLPIDCAGCGAPGVGVCARCLRPLLAPPRRVDQETRHLGGSLPTWALADYEGPARRLVLAYKNGGRRDLAPVLGLALAESVRAALPEAGESARTPPVLLVPMPSSARARRRRGEDTLLRCARRAAAELRGCGIPAEARPLLRQRRGVRDQVGLSARDRRRNLSGALVPTRRARRGTAPGARLVLVDDVVTTGATLAEAGRVLGSLGALPLAAAVVAATPGPPAS